MVKLDGRFKVTHGLLDLRICQFIAIVGPKTWLGTVRLDPHSLYPNDHHLIMPMAPDFTVSMFGDNHASHAHPLEQLLSDCNVFYEE